MHSCLVGTNYSLVCDHQIGRTPCRHSPEAEDNDNDRVAVAFLGSTDGTGNPYGGNIAGRWDLYVSYTYDGGLTWTTVKATTDPVQRGCIYDVITSPSCHRNLLDFMDAGVSTDGRVRVAYADGCVSATCVGPAGGSGDSTAARGTIARQTGGDGLYG